MPTGRPDLIPTLVHSDQRNNTAGNDYSDPAADQPVFIGVCSPVLHVLPHHFAAVVVHAQLVDLFCLVVFGIGRRIVSDRLFPDLCNAFGRFICNSATQL